MQTTRFNPILPGTPRHLGQWIDRVKAPRAVGADAELVRSGTDAGTRRKFELLYGQTFLEIGASFHATLRDYAGRVIRRDLGIHEAWPVASLLELVQPELGEMHRLGFIDDELFMLATDEAVHAFGSRR